jgi:hypothetical protein
VSEALALVVFCSMLHASCSGVWSMVLAVRLGTSRPVCAGGRGRWANSWGYLTWRTSFGRVSVACSHVTCTPVPCRGRDVLVSEASRPWTCNGTDDRRKGEYWTRPLSLLLRPPLSCLFPTWPVSQTPLLWLDPHPHRFLLQLSLISSCPTPADQ